VPAGKQRANGDQYDKKRDGKVLSRDRYLPGDAIRRVLEAEGWHLGDLFRENRRLNHGRFGGRRGVSSAESSALVGALVGGRRYELGGSGR
jgi:hypothetical protein